MWCEHPADDDKCNLFYWMWCSGVSTQLMMTSVTYFTGCGGVSTQLMMTSVTYFTGRGAVV